MRQCRPPRFLMRKNADNLIEKRRCRILFHTATLHRLSMCLCRIQWAGTLPAPAKRAQFLRLTRGT